MIPRPLAGAVVVVTGAGVAGLAVAACLAGRGARVAVLERAAGPSAVGAGIQLSPNAMAVLRAMGLAGRVDALSTRAEAVRLCDGLTGRAVLRLDLTRRGAERPYRFLHRADLIDALTGAAVAAGATLAYGRTVRAVGLDGPRPVAELEDGRILTPDLLVGADGLKSLAHRALNGVVAPFFTRQAAWRALIPGEAGAAPEAEVHMAPGRHVVSYPLRGGALRNIVAVEERAEWLAEGWSQPGDPQVLRATFADFGPRVTGWLAAVETAGLWGLYRHPVPRRWHAALDEGAAVILGDAAHPTLPFLAQGAAMALEDAWVLARSLGEGGIGEDALRAFGDRRRPRVERLVAAADGNARAYHLRGPARWIAHRGLGLAGRLAPGLMLRRQDWIWRHDVTAPDQASSVAQTGT